MHRKNPCLAMHPGSCSCESHREHKRSRHRPAGGRNFRSCSSMTKPAGFELSQPTGAIAIEGSIRLQNIHKNMSATHPWPRSGSEDQLLPQLPSSCSSGLSLLLMRPGGQQTSSARSAAAVHATPGVLPAVSQPPVAHAGLARWHEAVAQGRLLLFAGFSHMHGRTVCMLTG